MVISTENRLRLNALLEKYKITLKEQLPRSQWPSNHFGVFESIEQLKSYKYDTYVAGDVKSVESKPWIKQARRRAKELVKRATVCKDRNEATWRDTCEHIILSRFSAEISCKNCRKRVWRAEIEAQPNVEQDQAALPLSKRQEHREPCRCPTEAESESDGDSEGGTGLDELFVTRCEETVQHPSALANELPTTQRPDRVYGLHQTRKLRKRLFTKLRDRVCVKNILDRQPFLETGEPILFPFMVLEAKKSTTDDWNSIFTQTAFPIFTFLNVQRSLKSATQSGSRWISGPLVWFFMNRGEDWRIYVAYQSNPVASSLFSGQPAYATDIVQLWKGSITNLDDALQLSLIVDHMVDWARDVYRPAILQELKILANDDPDWATAPTSADSVIFSLKDQNIPDLEREIQPESPGLEAVDNFRQFDSHLGAIRHISRIRSKFLSLHLTSDNIQTFFQAVAQPNQRWQEADALHVDKKTRQFCARQILAQFRSHSNTVQFLQAKDLQVMEKSWTGGATIPRTIVLANTTFYCAHQINYYLSSYWDQVRELCVLSVTEDVFKLLLDESGLQLGRRHAKLPDCKPLGSSQMSHRLAQLKASSAEHSLLAAITRVACSILCHVDPSDGEKRWLHKDTDAGLWDLTNFFYDRHVIGLISPNAPYLSFSESDETMSRGMRDKEPIYWLSKLQVSSSSGVLVNARDRSNLGITNSTGAGPHCFYLVRESTEIPMRENLANMIKHTYENHDVYHTSRDNRRLSFSNRKYLRDMWNIERTYGICLKIEEYTRWVQSLGVSGPTRQGSPRGANDCGRYIFEREFFPWIDPRLNLKGRSHSQETKEWKRALKKRIKDDIRVWMLLARLRIRMGLRCCIICAKLLNLECKLRDTPSIKRASPRTRCWECERDTDTSNTDTSKQEKEIDRGPLIWLVPPRYTEEETARRELIRKFILPRIRRLLRRAAKGRPRIRHPVINQAPCQTSQERGRVEVNATENCRSDLYNTTNTSIPPANIKPGEKTFTKATPQQQRPGRKRTNHSPKSDKAWSSKSGIRESGRLDSLADFYDSSSSESEDDRRQKQTLSADYEKYSMRGKRSQDNLGASLSVETPKRRRLSVSPAPSVESEPGERVQCPSQ